MSLEITVVSAKDLKDVNLFTTMDVYAVVSIVSMIREHGTAQRTPVDKDCGSSPEWNYSMKFNIEEALAQPNGFYLYFRLKSDRRLLGDKEIGDVMVPIKELLDHNNGNEKVKSYDVKTPFGWGKGKLEKKGILNFSYKFGEKFENPVPQPTGTYKFGDLFEKPVPQLRRTYKFREEKFEKLVPQPRVPAAGPAMNKDKHRKKKKSSSESDCICCFEFNFDSD
ncbi:C2 calcium-dependent membrane targeting [Corchorus capsularis]|uniref:C2 calcium-dependent membrane targeting n=1 Tax=Corchorus capsularis TaxID=210143 RepID=A0A1R3G642_COCAP|nr:C2 calcium-dependent membrane targeting [Corchorus capsularis]